MENNRASNGTTIMVEGTANGAVYPNTRRTVYSLNLQFFFGGKNLTRITTPNYRYDVTSHD